MLVVRVVWDGASSGSTDHEDGGVDITSTGLWKNKI